MLLARNDERATNRTRQTCARREKSGLSRTSNFRKQIFRVLFRDLQIIGRKALANLCYPVPELSDSEAKTPPIPRIASCWFERQQKDRNLQTHAQYQHTPPFQSGSCRVCPLMSASEGPRQLLSNCAFRNFSPSRLSALQAGITPTCTFLSLSHSLSTSHPSVFRGAVERGYMASLNASVIRVFTVFTAMFCALKRARVRQEAQSCTAPQRNRKDNSLELHHFEVRRCVQPEKTRDMAPFPSSPATTAAPAAAVSEALPPANVSHVEPAQRKGPKCASSRTPCTEKSRPTVTWPHDAASTSSPRSSARCGSLSVRRVEKDMKAYPCFSWRCKPCAAAECSHPQQAVLSSSVAAMFRVTVVGVASHRRVLMCLLL